MAPVISAEDAIAITLGNCQMSQPNKGYTAYLAGSSVAAEQAHKPLDYSDIDLFTPNAGSYFALVAHLLNKGYTLWDEAAERLWSRHLNYGFNKWHTNSIRLREQNHDIETNVIYKKVDGHETTRLSQVLESFDFGLLAVGYEANTGRYHDMRPYFFGQDMDVNGPLPMLPYREDSISQGFMSQHIMLRSAGRYAKYADTYGYDLSLVKPVFVQGYTAYYEFKSQRSRDEDRALGDIALALGDHIEHDEFGKLHDFAASLPSLDGIQQIMESLE